MLALVRPSERALLERMVIDPMPDEGWRGRDALNAMERARIALVVECLERMLG